MLSINQNAISRQRMGPSLLTFILDIEQILKLELLIVTCCGHSGSCGDYFLLAGCLCGTCGREWAL